MLLWLGGRVGGLFAFFSVALEEFFYVVEEFGPASFAVVVGGRHALLCVVEDGVGGVAFAAAGASVDYLVAAVCGGGVAVAGACFFGVWVRFSEVTEGGVDAFEEVLVLYFVGFLVFECFFDFLF